MGILYKPSIEIFHRIGTGDISTLVVEEDPKLQEAIEEKLVYVGILGCRCKRYTVTNSVEEGAKLVSGSRLIPHLREF